MIKQTSLFVLLACSGCLFAAENLLTNTDFSQGMTDWWLKVSDTMKATGCRQGIEGSCWVAVIPDTAAVEPTGMLLGHAVNLEPGKTYRLSYTLTVEKAGTMRHLYQMSQRPWQALGLAEDVPVEAGTMEIVAGFTCTRTADTPAHLTLNLSNLKGKVSIGRLKLEEILQLPVSTLNEEWTVFADVDAPSSVAVVPGDLPGPGGTHVKPIQTALKNGGIDIAALNGGGFRTRARAMLYNEFAGRGPGVMQIGFSADWWMEVYLNGKSVYSTLDNGNGSQNYTPNDHVVEVPVQEGRNVLAVQVLSGSKGWRFVCGTPDPPITYTANDEWKAVDMGNVRVQEGSALDLSSLVEKPAGKLGRVTIGKEGSLAFAQASSVPVRMLGFNGFPYEIWKEPDSEVFQSNVRLFAQSARRQGYCLFRVHGLLDRWLCEGTTEDMSIQPEKLDRWDFLLSELKQEGIYCHLVIFSFGLYERSSVYRTTFDERDRHKLHFYLGGEWEREHFRYGAETILNHVNPYTGLAWKDDPLIAFVEFYNEQELGLDRMGATLKTFPETKAYLEREWRKWLVARHGDTFPPALSAQLKGVSPAAAPLPSLHDRNTEPANEFALFRMHISTECARWCEGVVRGTGYAGLTTQYNGSKKLGESAVRWQVSQVVDMHSYYRHPIGGWGAAGTRVEQSSSLDDAAGYWRNTNATRLAGRPFIVSEFNHCFWNPYQHEGGLVFGAYSALQGFSALEIHSGPVALGISSPKVGSFTCGASPVVRASEFLSACLYQRRDVKRAVHQVELAVPEDALKKNGMSMGAVSTEQSRLALMTGFSLAFPWAEHPAGTVSETNPDMRILPSGVAGVDAQDWFVDVMESKDGQFSLAEIVRTMKTNGILDQGNLTDPEQGIFQSDTGELTMRSREHLLKIRTPRTEAMTMEGGRREEIGRFSVENSSVPACVGICSVTPDPIAASRRMVLVYSTEMVNTGMVVGYDRQLMKDTGKSPALMRCGILSATLARERPGSLSLFALGFDGTRREQLPVSVTDGRLRIQIDTASLTGGPTPFFELVEENQ